MFIISQIQSRASSPVAHPMNLFSVPLPVIVWKGELSSLNPFKAFRLPLLLVLFFFPGIEVNLTIEQLPHYLLDPF